MKLHKTLKLTINEVELAHQKADKLSCFKLSITIVKKFVTVLCIFNES